MAKERNSFTKAEKTLSTIKNYVLPVVAFVCSIAIAWAILSRTVTTNTNAIERIEMESEENQEIVNIVLQRLAIIDTKLEYIIKEMDDMNCN